MLIRLVQILKSVVNLGKMCTVSKHKYRHRAILQAEMLLLLLKFTVLKKTGVIFTHEKQECVTSNVWNNNMIIVCSPKELELQVENIMSDSTILNRCIIKQLYGIKVNYFPHLQIEMWIINYNLLCFSTGSTPTSLHKTLQLRFNTPLSCRYLIIVPEYIIHTRLYI